MELKSILLGLEGLKVKGKLDIEINNISNNSKKIEKNDMFVAIKGFDTDGHECIKEAIDKGANAILAQIDCVNKKMIEEIPEDITLILAPNTRYALAIAACNFRDENWYC